MSLDDLDNHKVLREVTAPLEEDDGFIKWMSIQETTGIYSLCGLRAKWYH